jgi:long-chain acyl-CoA synthetase
MPATSPNQGQRTGGVTPPDAGCWVFDVDGCLVDSLTGTSLRPGAREILEHLAGRTRVFLWSAGGDDYARDRAGQFGVDHLVSGYFSKEGRDADGCYLTTHLPVCHGAAVFVDDRPEDMAAHVDVLAVSPYLAEDRHDRGLEQVARRAGLTGSSRR